MAKVLHGASIALLELFSGAYGETHFVIGGAAVSLGSIIFSGLAMLQVLGSPVSAASLDPEDLDWPSKANIEPRDPGVTPEPGEDLAISYNCGRAEPCDLSDFMARLHVCALFVIAAGDPVLGRTAVRSDTDECRRAVERERYGISSITKSIVSLLFGLVHRDPQYGGPVDLDSAAAETLASAGVSYPNREVTFRDLLQMSSGMRWSEEEIDQTLKILVKPDGSPAGPHRTLKDAVNARLQRAEFHPDRRFHYSGFDTQLLGILIEHRIASDTRFERPTLDAAMERLLWQNLPMNRYAEWNADFEGHPAAHCCAYTSAGDLARLGDWVLQEYNTGTGPGADWIRVSVSDTVDTSWTCEFAGTRIELRYGYHWWIPSGERNGFTAIGTEGQYLHVFPEQNVVIAQLSEQIASDEETCEAMLVHRLMADELAR